VKRLLSWAIEERKDGSFDLLHGNRPVATGLRHRHAVLDYLTANARPGERVYTVDPEDGYREEITRKLLRSKVLAAVSRTSGTARRLRLAAAHQAARRRTGTA
jgi:hypothetical protein